MVKSRGTWILFGCLLLGLGLIACASAAQPPDGGGEGSPVLAQQDPDPTPEPEPEPTPAHEDEPLERHVYTLGTPTPITSPPAHPEGLEGCRQVRMFFDDGNLKYQSWCMQELPKHVHNSCSSFTTAAEQLKCGEDIVNGYDSMLFRYDYAKCAGIESPGEVATQCSQGVMGATNKSFSGIFEGWEKMQIAGNQDPEVVKAWDATIACLEDKEFKNVDRELLFPWQRTDDPATHVAKEEALTGPDKDLRERLIEPSRDCAKQNGLFTAQEAAWAAALRQLSKTEPGLVADLIRDGLLEELEKPGVSIYVGGGLPAHADDAS